MKAIQLVAPTVVELVDIPVPEIGPADVLLRVAGAGICHSDLHVAHNPNRIFPRPVTLGHEVTGTVAAVGGDVRGWAEGDPGIVYLCWSCGQCRRCIEGAENMCEKYGRRAQPPAPGLGPDGGMAEYMRVPARYLLPLPGVDLVSAAPLADAALTPYHAIRASRDVLKPGAKAVIIGVGGLGHVAVQILRATSAVHVVAVDVAPARLAAARSHGAHSTVVAGPTAAEAILDMTAGLGAEAVFDFVGNDESVGTAVSAVAPGGVVHLIGLAGGQAPIAAEARDGTGWPWGASLRSSYGGTRADLVDCLALARDGLITMAVEQFALEDGLAAMHRLESGQVHGRAVLVP